MLGFEVAQLQDERDLRGDRAELLHDVLLGLRQGKVDRAVVVGEAGSPVERLNFLRIQDPQTPQRDLWVLLREAA